MDSSQLRYDTKLSGSTIIEVVVAMVVMMTVFGIAMLIFANITQSGLSVKKIRARALLNEVSFAITLSQGSPDKSFTAGGFKIEQVVKAYNGGGKLMEIDLAAYDDNQQKVAELHKIVINNGE